jgi:hypothetical protein
MVPMMSPTMAIMSDLISELPVTLLRTTKPKTISEKNSGGPNASAASARGGAKNASPRMAKLPATKDPMAQMASAGPARPFLAIW